MPNGVTSKWSNFVLFVIAVAVFAGGVVGSHTVVAGRITMLEKSEQLRDDAVKIQIAEARVFGERERSHQTGEIISLRDEMVKNRELLIGMRLQLAKIADKVGIPN